MIWIYFSPHESFATLPFIVAVQFVHNIVIIVLCYIVYLCASSMCAFSVVLVPFLLHWMDVFFSLQIFPYQFLYKSIKVVEMTSKRVLNWTQRNNLKIKWYFMAKSHETKEIFVRKKVTVCIVYQINLLIRNKLNGEVWSAYTIQLIFFICNMDNVRTEWHCVLCPIFNIR